MTDPKTNRDIMTKMKKTYGYARGIFLAAALAMACVSCEGYQDGGVSIGGEGVWPFSISAGQKGAGTDTRAVLRNGAYLWTLGDQAGLTVADANSMDPGALIAFNVRMTATTNSYQGVSHTTFTGALDQNQLDRLSSGERFDYYSYFPYNPDRANTFPNIRFSIPARLDLRPNEFKPAYTPMVADVVEDEKPAVYLKGQELVHGDQIHFDYKHIMSYAAIEMDVRLLPQPVTAITLINNNGTLICGTYQYDMSAAGPGYVGEYISGRDSITINIIDGLNVGNETVLYVPMPPGKDMSGETFTLKFTGGSSSNRYEDITIPGINFTRGRIHRLRVAPVVKYTADEHFTVSKEGYYHIAAWGGDGGMGGKGERGVVRSSGGTAQKTADLYYLEKGTPLHIYLGSTGESRPGDITGSGPGGIGGTNGYGSGAGGTGGKGFQYGVGLSGAGGGGGGGTFILKGSQIILVSGGGGGGGGGAGSISGTFSNGGSGGEGGGGDGGDGTNGGGAGATAFNGGSDGGTGGDGNQGANAPGGGGGGGGGGYNGGNGGNGGDNGLGGASKGGGGGKGGESYVATQVTKPGFTAPADNRPSDRTHGYAVITFVR